MIVVLSWKYKGFFSKNNNKYVDARLQGRSHVHHSSLVPKWLDFWFVIPQTSVLLMCCKIGKFRRTYLSDLDSGAIYKAGFSSPKCTLDSTQEALGCVSCVVCSPQSGGYWESSDKRAISMRYTELLFKLASIWF